jgi:hypothetical protein
MGLLNFRGMIKYLGFALILIFCASEVSSQKKKIRKRVTTTLVTIELTETSNWCGGARPSEEMEKEFRTPKPYPNCRLFLRKDTNAISKPVLYTIVTNEQGKASIKLLPGKYTVVDIKKKDDSVYNATLEKYKNATETTGPIDINCYKIFMAEPDFKIIVPKSMPKSLKVTHNYHKYCDWSGAPCVEFRGPYPP